MPPSGAEKSQGRTNGVLPISVTQQGDKPGKGSRGKAKISQDGVKMSIRYLPPGLKEFECTNILGDDWRVGGGKVDWWCFEPGKQARTPGKPSRPAVAYVHLTKPEFAAGLSDFVRNATWEDSGNTYNDPALIFPPFVEKCAFQRVPPLKDRADQRQGTIDTDPDFMAFLEELANPPAPSSATAEENADTAPAPTVTPLIEYLKAKKANRDKESASSKGARQSKQDGKSAKSKGVDESKKGKEKGDKPKEDVKILKKSTADASKDPQKATAPSGKATAAAAVPASTSQSAGSGEQPKSRRAGIAAAARILQRDLGLSPGTAHRRARLDAAKAEAEAKTTLTTSTSMSPPATSASKGAAGQAAPVAQAPKEQQVSPKSQASGRSRGRGAKNAEKGKSAENNANGSGATAANPPVLLKKRPEQASAQAPTSPTTGGTPASQAQKSAVTDSPSKASPEKSKPAPASAAQKKDKPAQITPGATRGFVKHANPSQGVTEPLLKQALGAYGTVTFVEIDKRKGFAYVDFAAHEGLAKAITASPVSVAQATVQVLERKDKKQAQGAASSGSATGPSSGTAEKETKEKSGHRRRGRRGGGGGGGGGGGEKNTPAGSSQGASGSAAG